MTRKRTEKQISHNMSQIKSKGTQLEAKMEDILKETSYEYESHPDDVFGKPDFINRKLKVAIFADSDFWHGFNWEKKKLEIKSNRDFWIPKIERNIKRDKEVSKKLSDEGWRVIRFWGHEIRRQPNKCKKQLLDLIA